MRDHEFKLKPSRQFVAVILLACGISVAAAFSLPVNHWLHFVALLIAVAYVGYILWRFGLLLSHDAIISIRHHSNGEWRLKTRRSEYPATILGDSTATTRVMVLRFKVVGHFWQQSCVIFRDSLSADAYRQLLVLLKTSC